MEAVPDDRRQAKFVSAVCFMLPDGRSLTVTGECPGRVGRQRQGTNGFGYDPLFIPDEVGLADGSTRPNTDGLTYAQLEDWQKDAISHRGHALEALRLQLPAFLDPAAAAPGFERDTKYDGDKLRRIPRQPKSED